MDEYGLGLLQHYPNAWHIFLQVFFATELAIGAFYLLAKNKDLMMPGIRDRDVHTKRKPRIGGLAMWLVVLITLLFIATGHSGYLLAFQGPKVGGLDKELWGIFAGMLILLGFGIWDDLKSLSPRAQLLGQVLAATALVVGGLQVSYVRLPFVTNPLYLDHWMLGGVAVWSAIFTYIWVILMINVMNFFDGLDGLAGSVAMTSSVVLLLVSLRLGFTGAATLCIVLFGITAGFLPWNWYPSRLFMGTVGSQLLGFLLAVVAIISGAKVATAVLVLGIPLFDALVVIIRRLLARQSPFKADQRHLHHRLLKIGLPVPWVVVLINVVAVTFGVLALRTQRAEEKGMLTLVLALCMIVFIIITYLLEQRETRA